MPTQAQLDKLQDREQSQSGTIGTVRRGGIHDIDTQPRQDDNKEGVDERIQNDGIDRIESPLTASSSGGGGLGNDTVTAEYIDGTNTPQTATFVIVT